MKTYTVIKRTIGSYMPRVLLSKGFQSGDVIEFYVRTGLVKKFPKKGGFLAINMASLIFVDGRLYKNVFGPVGQG